MKKKKVKEMLYGIRVRIIDEIEEQERMEENTAKEFVKHGGSFVYGYKRGLTEAAMIMLDEIIKEWPEEEDG